MVNGGIYMEYYIFISNDCNLNCSYCSILLKKEKGNIPQEPAFSVEELNNFIDKTQRKYNDKTADIVFLAANRHLIIHLSKKLFLRRIQSLRDLMNTTICYIPMDCCSVRSQTAF